MNMNLLMKYLPAAVLGATAIMLLFYFADQGVLATAAKYADDEPKLVKFMLDMGYPKKGEWCGEFAASIIKRAGGAPPFGAAIASNWRKARQSEQLAVLKQSMIERGMSAEEIERVINAGMPSKKQTEEKNPSPIHE